MILRKVAPLKETDAPLELVDVPTPKPARGEVLIRVSTCGVCHTELDEIEGRTPPSRLPMVLGHQVVGLVEALGDDATRFEIGDRVGVGWIYSSTGDAGENLSSEFRATGRDAHGGYAEYMTVSERYAYPIPDAFGNDEAAPLLCAGAVGYRALKLTGLTDGQALGFTGFGGSAHLVLQLVRHKFPKSPVFVFARDESARNFALELGAVWAGATTDRAPQPLHAIIDTTPAWKPVVEALRNLRPGGRLVINAIRKENRDKDSLLDLNYHDDLWMEREIKSVANVTHFDLEEFLPIAAQARLRPRVTSYSLEDANRALIELKFRPVQGAKVLMIHR
jgi:propanol-preferring alcohol dehydrogenase